MLSVCACAHACPCMFLCLCLLLNHICTGVVTGDITKYLCRPHEGLLKHVTGTFFHIAAFVSILISYISHNAVQEPSENLLSYATTFFLVNLSKVPFE